MTMQEKIINQFRKKLMESVKDNLMKKYPEASEADIQKMIDEYNKANPEPI